MPEDILIIENEPLLKRSLTSALRKANFGITAVSDYTEALEIIAGCKPDLVIMEVSLANTDDVEICCMFRSKPATVSEQIVQGGEGSRIGG